MFVAHGWHAYSGGIPILCQLSAAPIRVGPCTAEDPQCAGSYMCILCKNVLYLHEFFEFAEACFVCNHFDAESL